MTAPTIITNENQLKFGDRFEELLTTAKFVEIVSGYIGHSAFMRVQDQFRHIVSNGGRVSVTVGLGYFEGLTKRIIHS